MQRESKESVRRVVETGRIDPEDERQALVCEDGIGGGSSESITPSEEDSLLDVPEPGSCIPQVLKRKEEVPAVGRDTGDGRREVENKGEGLEQFEVRE